MATPRTPLHHRHDSPSMILFLLFTLGMMSTITTTADAYLLLKSNGTGGWATGIAQTELGRSLMVVGTLFTDTFWDQSFPSQETFRPQCMVIEALTHEQQKSGAAIPHLQHVIHSPQGIEPQVCLGGGIVGSNDLNGGGEIGTILGTKGHESSLQTLEGLGLVYEMMMGGDAATTNIGKTTKFPDRTFPVAFAASETKEDNNVFVGLMSTGGLQYVKQNTPMADLQDLATYLKLLKTPPLSNTYLEVLRYDYVADNVAFSNRFPINGVGRNGAISSMVAVAESHLIVAGSTNEYSSDFFGINPNRKDTDDDWDGYIMFLNSETGEFIEAFAVNSQSGKNDFVEDVCAHGHDLYIVGKTEGYIGDTPASLEDGAFVLKMNWQTREYDWQKTIPGMINAQGCVADSTGVYVGFHGNQFGYHGGDGSVISQDAIITKFPKNNDGSGWRQWLDTTDRDTTTTREDYIVGLDILSDSGNIAVVLNSANFDLGLNDIVIVELDKSTGANELNIAADEDDSTEDRWQPPNYRDHVKKQNGNGVDSKKLTIGLAIAIPIFLALVVLIYHCCSRARTGIEKEGIADPDEEVIGICHDDTEQQQHERTTATIT